MIIFQGAIIALLVIGYFAIKINIFQKYINWTIRLYVCFLIGLLLIFSITPSVKFFEASVNHEIIRGIKHDQLELARQRESRNRQLRNYYRLMEHNHKLDTTVISVYEHRMDRGIYSKFVGSRFYIQGKTCLEEMDSDCKDFIKKNKLRDNNKGEYIINSIRPVYDSTSVKTKYLESDRLLNGNQVWSLCEKSLVFNYTSTTEKYGILKPDSCRIYTDFQRPGIFNSLGIDKTTNKLSLFQKSDVIFILILLFVFYGLYRLILFGARRIFGISILEMYTGYNFANFIFKRIKAGQSVMVIRSSFIDPTEDIKKQFPADYRLISHDFAKQDEAKEIENPSSEKDVLIIENFAIDYYSLASLHQQLNEISEKIRKNEKMVIIGTTAPHLILEYLEHKVKPAGDEKEKGKEKPATTEKGKDKPDAMTETWEHLLLTFKNILSNVSVTVTPEKYDPCSIQAGGDSKMDYKPYVIDDAGGHDESIESLIGKELTASTYLQRYSREMMKFYNELLPIKLPDQIIKDRVLARIMELCSLYYDSILDSCTPMEQFVLGDAASDMIVNSKNQRVVIQLIQRGLFVADSCTIRFMNESFRKHVLLRFTSEEKARLKEKLGDTGTNWQGYKLFLILIMIGLFTFLFIANKAILDNLNKLFIVLGGGTVLITNLSGFLTRKETGNPK